MTKDDGDIVQQIEDALAGMTPGPGGLGCYYEYSGTSEEKCFGQIVNDDDYGIGIVDERAVGAGEPLDDLAGIVALRNLTPALVAEVKRLASENKALREAARHAIYTHDTGGAVAPSSVKKLRAALEPQP